MDSLGKAGRPCWPWPASRWIPKSPGGEGRECQAWGPGTAVLGDMLPMGSLPLTFAVTTDLGECLLRDLEDGGTCPFSRLVLVAPGRTPASLHGSHRSPRPALGCVLRPPGRGTWGLILGSECDSRTRKRRALSPSFWSSSAGVLAPRVV